MKKLVELLNKANANDVWFNVDESAKAIYIYFEDWDGFDEDWSEVIREYDDVDAIDAIDNYLYEIGDEVDGYEVYVSYASDNI